MSEEIRIKVLSLKQPIGNFYVGVVNATELYKICKAEVRRIERKNDIDNYIGIQRELNPKRVKEIKEYVRTIDASFPNSIIISLKKDFLVDKKSTESELVIKKDENAATIIDGQHRLSGFEYGEHDFDLIVTIFIDLEDEEKALLFSIINTKHTKITGSLSQDLYEFSTLDTPPKLAHNIAKSMNSDENSPWFKKIKMLGRKTDIYEEGIITQSTFTKEIIDLICKNEDIFNIRNQLKKGVKKEDLKKYFNYDDKKQIFWELYMEGKDELIFKILNNYFVAVKEVFPSEWVNKKYILCKTTGYIALMKLFRKIYLNGISENDLSISFFKKYFESVKENLMELTSENYESGGKGSNRLAKDFGY